MQITPISYYFYTLYPLYTHLHPIFPFPHLTFYSRNSKYCIHLLFFPISSLHKQPFITAHFVHHCTLKQALMEGLITEKARRCLSAERALGTKSSPRSEERSARREAKSATGLQRSVK